MEYLYNDYFIVSDENGTWSSVSYFPTPAPDYSGARVKYHYLSNRADREAALLSQLSDYYKGQFKTAINNVFAYENTDAVSTNYRDQYNGIIYQKDGILYQLNILKSIYLKHNEYIVNY